MINWNLHHQFFKRKGRVKLCPKYVAEKVRFIYPIFIQFWNNSCIICVCVRAHTRVVLQKKMLTRKSTLTWPCGGSLHQSSPIISHRFPSAINNVRCSPCLSFNSIFTPCQLHLEPFHHHCSPSATIPPQDLSSPLMFDERSNNGSQGVLPVPLWLLSELFFCLFFSFYSVLHPQLLFGASSSHFLPKDFSPFPRLPQGKFGLDWISQGKVGHWLWSVYWNVIVKVKPDAAQYIPASILHQPDVLCLPYFPSNLF